MNKFFIVVFILAATAFLSAQEFTSQDYSTAIVNNRYEINYTIPTNDRETGDYFDVFIFARPSGGVWTRLRALFGEYRHVQGYYSHKVRWEPVFDYMKLQKYEFRIYAVNRKFLPATYSYNDVNEVGTLNLYSDLDDMSYKISGQPAYFRLDPALPAGDYEVEIYKGEKRRNLKTIAVGHMQLTDVDMTPVEGYLTLSSNIPKAVYYVNGDSYPGETEIILPVGMHQVWASVTSPVTGTYNSLIQGVRIEKQKNHTQHFEFDYGFLTVTSNEPKTQFMINGKKLGKVQNLLLPAGIYSVEAFLPVSSAATFCSSKQEEMLVTKDETSKRAFNFEKGKLTLTSNLPGVTFLVDGVAYDNVENLSLYTGTHRIIAIPEPGSPYQQLQEDITLSTEEKTHTMFFEKTDEIRTLEKRKEFGLYFENDVLGAVVLNNYFKLGTAKANPLDQYEPIGLGVSVTGVRINTLSPSYEAKYPRLYLGFGLLDEFIAVQGGPEESWGNMLDILTVSGGIVTISKRAGFFSSLDVTGSMSFEYPYLTRKDGYIYASMVEIDKDGMRSFTTFYPELGVKAKLRLGWRIAKGNYLYLNLGVRHMEEYEGYWYDESQLLDWRDNGGSFPELSACQDCLKRIQPLEV